MSPMPTRARRAAVLTLACVLAGCSTTRTTPSGDRTGAAPGGVDRTVALIGNEPVYAGDLTPALFEIAGRDALRSHVLDVTLRRELASRGLEITRDDIEREQELFRSRLAPSGNAAAAGALAPEIYRQRALGPQRRASFFWQNAALRTLVGAGATPTEAEIESAIELAYGPKSIARVIVAETERDAAEIRRALGPRPGVTDFVRLAEQRSIDPTATRGGLLPPVHLGDPNYPLAIRDALRRLEPGEISGVIPIAGGSAIVMLDRREPAGTPPDSARAQLERELFLQRQRAAMDALARRLVAGARVDVLDRSLGWSWDGP